MEFIIEIVDRRTECISKEVEISFVNINELLKFLGWQEFDENAAYTLNREDVKRLKEICKISFDAETSKLQLRSKNYLDELPYEIHTNRELQLMLDGLKPLSVFACDGSDFSKKIIQEDLFDPYVQLGRFAKEEYTDILDRTRNLFCRFVFYALPEEFWRIKAYRLLQETGRQCGWSDAFERLEGSLLGYTDEQNDAFMALRKRTRL